MKVVCVLTGDKYTEEDVYKLKYMTDKNISAEYEFICITDRDYIRGIQVINIPADSTLDGWWNKLYMFDTMILSDGDILYFDLDVVIQKPLDHLIASIDFTKLNVVYPYWKDFDDVYTKKEILAAEARLNSSIIAFRAGTQQYIWDKFTSSIDEYCINYYGIDRFITNEGFEFVTFPEGFVYSRMYGKSKYEMVSTRYCYYPECTVCLLNGMKDISIVKNYTALFDQYYPDYRSMSSII
jgi:hypothetical protein